jgi:hypothetical protein
MERNFKPASSARSRQTIGAFARDLLAITGRAPLIAEVALSHDFPKVSSKA